MFKRFISYYKPHKKMLALDMLAALFIAIIGMVYPVVTRAMLEDYIPKDGQFPVRIQRRPKQKVGQPLLRLCRILRRPNRRLKQSHPRFRSQRSLWCMNQMFLRWSWMR